MISLQLRQVVFYSGEPIYGENIPIAQRAVEHACKKKGGFVAPAHLLLENWPYPEQLTANSEDISGLVKVAIPKLGIRKGDCVVATYHGGNDGKWGLLTPDKLDRALELRRQSQNRLNRVNPLYTAILSDLYVGDVLTPLVADGSMPDGRMVQVFSYKQLLAGEAKEHNTNCTPYVVVRTLALARKTISGLESIDRLTDEEGKVTDSQVITYAGSIANAQGVIQRTKDRLEKTKLGVYHPFNDPKFNPEQHSGHLLFLWNKHDYYGLSGNDCLSGSGLPVRVVAAEPQEDDLVREAHARGGESLCIVPGAVGPRLEDMVAIVNNPDLNRQGMIEAITAKYQE